MQRRIIISILLSISVILFTLGVVSYLNVQRSIRRSLENHLQQARIIANYTDALLRNNILRLFDISLSGRIDLEDDDWAPEKQAVKTAYQYSIFSDGIYLLDTGGNVLLSHPPGRTTENLIGNPWVSQGIRTERALVSDIYTSEKTGRRVIYVLVPLKDVRGEKQGLVIGEIDPTHYVLNRIMQAVPAGNTTFLELVDGQGVVIASNVESRLFSGCDHDQFMANLIRKKEESVATCHRCHVPPGIGGDDSRNLVRTTDMMAFAPIAEANWGVAVREPKEIVFSPATSLKRNFSFLAAIALISSLILASGMSRGIVKPIRQLTTATRRIADGNLSEPVHVTSRDEIGILANSFEKMRTRLSESLEEIRNNNLTLERRVEKRTRALQRHRKRLAVLLQEVIDAQENERKRIARELHDETSQSLTALGISMDLSEVALRNGELKPEELQRIRNTVGQVLDRLRLLIRDLRPPVIDDQSFAIREDPAQGRLRAMSRALHRFVRAAGFDDLQPGSDGGGSMPLMIPGPRDRQVVSFTQ